MFSISIDTSSPSWRVTSSGGDERRAGQQDRRLRRLVVPAVVLDKFLAGPNHFGRRGRPIEDGPALASDPQPHLDVQWVTDCLVRDNTGPDGKALRVDLALREIQQVLALYVAATDVGAHGVADDPVPVQYQRQFWLRNVPLRVPSDADGVFRSDGPARRRLEVHFR